ncbi:hypothetical protein [Sulfolobus islandicus rod-shaped virus 2]|uniref:Uncharacterized protein n=1 Tax=Sulfolobus islandicus rod-shaped virus 2 TaxID=157899 RepID=Q8V9L7_SIRV2|nr:hypothetical protein SIRV2gp52 [Sulfolobus islandicus rod-shaped virus 2]CAC87327.1 hypothetical protein [Sulfolobus islandicus rod-shaped virus 2]
MIDEKAQEKVINLSQKYVNSRKILAKVRRNRLERKIIKELAEFYGIRKDNIELFNNEIEFEFKRQYEIEDLKQEINVIVNLKIRKENNKLKLLEVKLEKSITSNS